MSDREQLDAILQAFLSARPSNVELGMAVGNYLNWHGCWSTWLDEPESNIREDDFHAVGFRMEKVLQFKWKGKCVYLTEARINEAILRCV